MTAAFIDITRTRIVTQIWDVTYVPVTGGANLQVQICILIVFLETMKAHMAWCIDHAHNTCGMTAAFIDTTTLHILYTYCEHICVHGVYML